MFEDNYVTCCLIWTFLPRLHKRRGEQVKVQRAVDIDGFLFIRPFFWSAKTSAQDVLEETGEGRNQSWFLLLSSGEKASCGLMGWRWEQQEAGILFRAPGVVEGVAAELTFSSGTELLQHELFICRTSIRAGLLSDPALAAARTHPNLHAEAVRLKSSWTKERRWPSSSWWAHLPHKHRQQQGFPLISRPSDQWNQSDEWNKD